LRAIDEDDARQETCHDEDYLESVEQAWITPPKLLAELRAEFGFSDFDALWAVTNLPKPE
jgi:hypothetical protein